MVPQEEGGHDSNPKPVPKPLLLLVGLPLVLQDLVLDYLAPEELYIYNKVATPQSSDPVWAKHVNKVTSKGALVYAARTGWIQGLEVVGKALDAYHAHLALRHAAASGHVEAMEWIARTKRSPISLAAANRALEEAAKGGHQSAIEWLISTAGANELSRALYEAAASGHLATMKWLAPKCDPYWSGIFGAAAGGGHVAAMEWVAVFSKGKYDASDALRMAARMGQIVAMEWLVTNTAPTTSVGHADNAYTPATTGGAPFTINEYNTALWCAAQGGHIGAMEWSAARGANDWNGALFHALRGHGDHCNLDPQLRRVEERAAAAQWSRAKGASDTGVNEWLQNSFTDR